MVENDGNIVRFRLVFEDRRLLDKSQLSQGYSRSWFFFKPDITNIGDLASQIRQCFGLRHRIVLLMDDFTLPSFESTCTIRDNDIIMVKKKDSKHKDSKHVDSKMMQPQPMQNQDIPVLQQQRVMTQPAPHPPHVEYQQDQPPTIWNQQSSQISPPAHVPASQQHQLPSPLMSHCSPQTGGMTPGQMQPPQPSQVASDEVRTLWIGDLQYWMDESYIYGCFNQTGEVLSVKLIHNKHMQSEGYGFIEFASRSMAQQVLQTYNGQMMPISEQTFNLNWASLATGERRGDDGSDCTIFVGDLAPDVTDYLLQETFKTHYSSVKGAKVVIDRATGKSKGYGFVKFGDLNEQSRAMTEMNGAFCSSRPMRIGSAPNKNNPSIQQQNPTNASYQCQQGTEFENDPNNTTIFVRCLDPSVSDDLLRQLFSPYGELVYVKIPVGKRFGFVQFANRGNAEEALQMLNGTLLGGHNIRLSWCRTPNK